MPTKLTVRRKYVSNTDDLLFRLIALSEREQELVLSDLLSAIEAAEDRILNREATFYAARNHPQAASAGLPA